MKDLFPDAPLDHTFKAKHGAEWSEGNYCFRNFHGYFQQRERGSRHWQFVIYAFGGEPEEWGPASVYRIRDDGELVLDRDVMMDPQDRLHIHGRKYGRAHWHH